MSGSRNIFIALGTAFCLTSASCFAADKLRSISTSRQFLVYGGDVRVRGAICDLAERTKADLLQLLRVRDNWKTPLIVNLDYPRANYPETPAAQLDLSQLGYGLKLQLNLLISGEINSRVLDRELLRAILVEMMYRDRANIAAGTPYVTPPDWLVAGLLALQPGRDSDGDAELLRTIMASRKIAPLEVVVRQRCEQLDQPSRQLYMAYARALVQLLLDAPAGPSKLARLITDLSDAPNDAVADLRAHFPETLGPASCKWWALSVAQLSEMHRYETLSAPETAARLDQVLRFFIPAGNGTSHSYSLGDYPFFRKLPASRQALRQVGQQLLLLGTQAHPSYRPIVQEDYDLTELLAHGKTRRVAEWLEQLASDRATIDRQLSAVDDYLNWYEATQTKTISGVFTHLLQNSKPADDEALPRRRDPISVYLDSIETETN